MERKNFRGHILKRISSLEFFCEKENNRIEYGSFSADWSFLSCP